MPFHDCSHSSRPLSSPATFLDLPACNRGNVQRLVRMHPEASDELFLVVREALDDESNPIDDGGHKE